MMLNQSAIEIPTWTYAYANLNSVGKIKALPADFIVEEKLPFDPEGSGEHAFVQIKKSGENTEYVSRLLARFANVRQRDVSYAGLKDRHAITTQWFSVWLPGKEDPDWKQIETEHIKIMKTVRHARKLKRGVLSGNNFQILIRDWQGNREVMENQLQLIKQQGIPNYFGSQRFGLRGQNVNKALEMFRGAKVRRELRSIYLSAARSYLFNQLLSERVATGSWNQGVCGDVFIFDQSNSYFKTDHFGASAQERVKTGEIHPSGLMVGKGGVETCADALALEKSILNAYPDLVDGLLKFDLKADRRALRVFVCNLQWEFQQDSVLLSFFLPPSCYATSVLREVLNR